VEIDLIKGFFGSMRFITLIFTILIIFCTPFSLASDKEFRKILEVGPKAGRVEIERQADALMEALGSKMSVVSNDPRKSGIIFEKMSEILFAKDNLLLSLASPSETHHTGANVKLGLPDKSDYGPTAQFVNQFINSMSQASEQQLENAFVQGSQNPLSFWFGLGLALEDGLLDFKTFSHQMLSFLMKRLSDPPKDVAEFKDSSGLRALKQRWSKILLQGGVTAGKFDSAELLDLGDRYGVFNSWSEKFLLVYKNVPYRPALFLKVFESEEGSDAFSETEKVNLIKSVFGNLFSEADTPEKILAFKNFVDQVSALSSPKLASIIRRSKENLRFTGRKSLNLVGPHLATVSGPELIPDRPFDFSLSLLEKCRNIFSNIRLLGKRKPSGK
jgi:hypothetical protein